MLNQVTGMIENAYKVRHTGSAMSPLIWLNGVVTAPCLILYYMAQWPKCLLYIIAIAVLIIFSLFQYDRMARKDPRLLMSEGSQVDLAKLDYIKSKGDSVTINPIEFNFGSEPSKPEGPKAPASKQAARSKGVKSGRPGGHGEHEESEEEK